MTFATPPSDRPSRPCKGTAEERTDRRSQRRASSETGSSPIPLRTQDQRRAQPALVGLVPLRGSEGLRADATGRTKPSTGLRSRRRVHFWWTPRGPLPLAGEEGGVAPLVPFSNTTVKRSSAGNTSWVTARENRSFPANPPLQKSPGAEAHGVFLLLHEIPLEIQCL